MVRYFNPPWHVNAAIRHASARRQRAVRGFRFVGHTSRWAANRYRCRRKGEWRSNSTAVFC
jgi:hypothetical protein